MLVDRIVENIMHMAFRQQTSAKGRCGSSALVTSHFVTVPGKSSSIAFELGIAITQNRECYVERWPIHHLEYGNSKHEASSVEFSECMRAFSKAINYHSWQRQGISGLIPICFDRSQIRSWNSTLTIFQCENAMPRSGSVKAPDLFSYGDKTGLEIEDKDHMLVLYDVAIADP